MEDTRQKQMASLQVSLTAAMKSLTAEDIAKQPGKPDASSILDYNDFDTTSVGTHTCAESTPYKFSNHSHDAGVGQQPNGSVNAISHLVNEFEQRKHVFDDDAMFLVEVKSGQSASTMNPDDELRKLEHRFEAWKREYKVKLRETKVTLQKLDHTESDKKCKKWCGKKTTRGVMLILLFLLLIFLCSFRYLRFTCTRQRLRNVMPILF